MAARARDSSCLETAALVASPRATVPQALWIAGSLSRRNSEPRMAARVVDRLFRSGKPRIGEAADGDRDRRRLPCRIPKDRRAACLAEVKHDWKAAVALPREGSRLPTDLDVVDLKECCDAECAARPALAFQTVAERDLGRLASAFDPKLAAAAACCSRHGSGLQQLTDPKTKTFQRVLNSAIQPRSRDLCSWRREALTGSDVSSPL
jgi:hypothetical protein